MIWSAAAIALLLALFPGCVFAATIFAGVGNDGYFTDLQGVYGAMSHLPGLHGLPDHYLHENLDGPAIAVAINNLAPVVGAGDTLIWFYSGHGGWKYDGADHDESAVGSFAADSFDETIGLRYGANPLTDDGLSGAFSALAASGATIVTIFDACYAGGFIGGVNDLNRVPGLTFLGSSTELEDSYSYDDEPFGIFTQGLISGLEDGAADANNDGLLMSGEWFDFAANYTEGRVDNQHPVFWGDDDLLISNFSPVPLPSAFLLFGSGLAGLFAIRKKK
jgi:hypothetical protein